MRKTKKRVTAATKLQALARGKHVRSQQKRQNNAVTKLQALARGKRDRRTATVKKQQKQVRGRSAYKSYMSSFTVDNTQKLGGFSGLDLAQPVSLITAKRLLLDSRLFYADNLTRIAKFR